MKSETNYVLGFWVVSIILAVGKIVFTLRPEIDLFTEEAQYWLWSRNLAWHYYSKPPLIAVFNWFSTSIFGVNELGVRINAILLGIGTAWVVFRFTQYLYGSAKVAFWASILIMSMPAWVLFSTFHLTDSELAFFWILSMYLAFRGIKEDKKEWWILAGLASGFGLMAKSIMIVIGPFILVYLILTHRLKVHWKNFLIFLLIGAVGFLPGLIWNWQNDFSTYKHLAFLGGMAGQNPSFDLLPWLTRFGEYWGGQIAMISIFLFPVFLASVYAFFKKPTKDEAFLVLPALLCWLGFGAITLYANVEANWPIFAYSTLPIFFSKWIFEQSEKWLKFRNWGVALGVGLPLLLITPDFTPVKNWDSIKKAEKASFKRLIGYKQIANRVAFLRDSLEMREALVISESYHMASEMAFYLPEHPKTFTINMGSRKNQFDLWEGLECQIGKNQDGIFVSWISQSPDQVLTFDSLIYEEKLKVRFKGDSLRCATIQFWKNLQDYQPVKTETY
ncbi:MAG TPA: glycosyltransferase family 39 protein [Algoriphagus sp.]|nr:glycosyltransferase family 39 protein [Algoriphagus sp.]